MITTATVLYNIVMLMCSIFIMFIALLRQNNSAWEAYFIVTDDQPFDAELRATLSAYGDARLHFLDIDMKYRQKVGYMYRN